jgi:hypothetical protein
MNYERDPMWLFISALVLVCMVALAMFVLQVVALIKWVFFT